MVLGLRRVSPFPEGMVCVLLVCMSCSSGGQGRRQDAAISGSGGVISASAPVGAGGQPGSASGGIPGTGGATRTGGVGGWAASGGMPGTSGATPSGGMQGTGGATTTGGDAGTGAASATGGSPGRGGATASGGIPGGGGATGAGGQSTATSAPGTDGASVDAPLADAPRVGDGSYPLVDGPSGLAVIDPDYAMRHFDELVQGTWLVGWYGGQDHFSWLRITSSSGDLLRGELAVLAEPSIPAGVPYWWCNGSASWELPQRPLTLDLRLEPAGCARESLIFEWLRPTSWRGALLEARISAFRAVDGGYGPSNDLTGLKYPDDVCSASFTSCNAGL
jgi:hypothetical protein